MTSGLFGAQPGVFGFPESSVNQIIVITGAPNTGIFIYEGTPTFGTLIGSWAGEAGTDPYGNTYPLGLSVSEGIISGSVISGSTFEGTDFIINSNGGFFYSGTPAAGNLSISIAAVAGTDGFGNAYPAGIKMFTGSLTITDPALITFISGSTTTGSIASQSVTQRLQVTGPKGISLPCSGNNVIMDSLSFIACGSDGTGAVPAPWQNITTTLLNGWTGFFKWRRGAENEIKFQCSLVPGADTDLTIICNLFGISPAAAQTHAVWCNALRTGAVGAATEGPALRLDTSGNVRCLGIAAAATEVSGCGYFPLDN